MSLICNGAKYPLKWSVNAFIMVYMGIRLCIYCKCIGCSKIDYKLSKTGVYFRCNKGICLLILKKWTLVHDSLCCNKTLLVTIFSSLFLLLETNIALSTRLWLHILVFQGYLPRIISIMRVSVYILLQYSASMQRSCMHCSVL